MRWLKRLLHWLDPDTSLTLAEKRIREKEQALRKCLCQHPWWMHRVTYGDGYANSRRVTCLAQSVDFPDCGCPCSGFILDVTIHGSPASAVEP